MFLTYVTINILPSNLAQAVTLPICIGGVFGSNLGGAPTVG
jgi:hypothetical protein